MSTDSIGAIASTSSASSTGSSSATALTAETKSKLESLGINTTNITTEAEGQQQLKMAEAQRQSAQKSNQNQSEDSIKTSAKSLAAELGVSVADDDTTDTILSNIGSKISELQAAAGTDQTKLAEVQQYQSEYDALSQSYSSAQASQAQLSGSLNSLASYNKIYQGLS